MITFKREDGYCPYFVYNGVKYFIHDEKNRSSWFDCEYTYELRAQKEVVIIHEFKTVSEREQFILDSKAYLQYRSGTDACYKKGPKLLCTQGLTIIERHDYELLSSPFESYSKCLEFSKAYVQRIINEMTGAGEQISLLGGGA